MRQSASSALDHWSVRCGADCSIYFQIDRKPDKPQMGTMWTTLAGLNWTTIAGVVGSVAPLITILIAVRALGSWKRTLQNQRVDECISAASVLIGSLERFKKIKGRVRGSATQEAFDQLLASFHNFDCAYRITCRYRPDLDPNASHHVAKHLLFLDVDDDGSAPIEQRADGAANSLFLIIDVVSPWPRPKEPGALSRLVGRLRFAVRRHRE
jgi:hypothetical protein